MKISFSGNFLGFEEKDGKGGKYWLYTFADENGQTLNVMSKSSRFLTDVVRLALYDVNANLKLGGFNQNSSCNLLAMQKAKG